MNLITTIVAKLSVASSTIQSALFARRDRANAVAAERGSVTLEQIIWTVSIAVIAIAIVAVVVAAINSKAAELPL